MFFFPCLFSNRSRFRSSETLTRHSRLCPSVRTFLKLKNASGMVNKANRKKINTETKHNQIRKKNDDIHCTPTTCALKNPVLKGWDNFIFFPFLPYVPSCTARRCIWIVIGCTIFVRVSVQDVCAWYMVYTMRVLWIFIKCLTNELRSIVTVLYLLNLYLRSLEKNVLTLLLDVQRIHLRMRQQCLFFNFIV